MLFFFLQIKILHKFTLSIPIEQLYYYYFLFETSKLRRLGKPKKFLIIHIFCSLSYLVVLCLFSRLLTLINLPKYHATCYEYHFLNCFTSKLTRLYRFNKL